MQTAAGHRSVQRRAMVGRIAVNNLSTRIPADAFWFAAMQTLKAAYAGEQK
ncbi:hypothetical protein [Acinetobacter baumannii]|uniref:hypothetical protein n=1 Tax=Acinetobacter baumannii TaxID=470 RepID=UPI001BC886A9|nr:hypothetical protein [Acinetobacter baumannii]